MTIEHGAARAAHGYHGYNGDHASPDPSGLGSRARIAVLAVHGVGHHAPGETGNAIAALLAGQGARAPGSTHARYSGFGAEPIAVSLDPLRVPDLTDEPRPRGWRVFNERRGFFQTLRDDRKGAIADVPLDALAPQASAGGARTTAPAAEPDAPEPPLATRIGYEAYRTQLAGYEPGDRAPLHHSMRWRGTRTAAGAAPSDGDVDVDVYEMHWSDLSRRKAGTLAFFRALYQLLLHLPSLGRQAIDAAVAEQPGGRWRGLQNTYTWAVRLLVIGVPVLSVALLITGLAPLASTFVPERLGVAGSAALAIGVVAAASLAGTYWAAQTGRVGRVAGSTLGWVLVPVVGALVGAAIGAALVVGLPRPNAAFPDMARVHACLLAEWWAVAGAGALVGFRAYAKVRRGALVAGAVALGIAAATFLAFAVTARTDAQLYAHASLWTIQVLYALFAVFWIAFYVLAVAAAVCAFACGRANRDDDPMRDEAERAQRARARAVLRTVRLCVSLSVAGFLVTAVIAIGVVYQTLAKRAALFRGVDALPSPVLSDGLFLSPAPYRLATWLGMPTYACPGSHPGSAQTCASAQDYVTALFAGSTTFGLPIALVLFAVCALVLVWMALPSVVSEANAPSNCTNADAEGGGLWLSRGMEATTVVGWTLWVAMFVVIPVCSVLGGLGVHYGWHAPRPLAAATLALLDTTGALLATSAVALAGLLAKFGGTALDVVLDVDNYLRTYPDDETPTARIAERYASVLRHIARPDDAAPPPYDALIIVAHSLGTTISADVLRTLRLQAGDPKYGDKDLTALGFGPDGDRTASLPIHFFTMGCPARQLMNRFFPHRFWWVRDFPDGGASRPAETFDKVTARPPLRPDPRALGLASWGNAYRTGDYVGRALWIDRWYCRTTGGDGEGRYGRQALSVLADAPCGVPRWEACIGLGAHTHYWDPTAPDVAEHLDELINSAVRDRSTRRPPASVGTP